MGKAFDRLQPSHRAFLAAQPVFFVATAPTATDGHVNVSPKGLDSLRVLADDEIAYVDFVGSGAETIAHVRDNGRIVLMACAFSGDPRIVRVHGRGTVLEPGEPAFAALRQHFPPARAVRSIVHVHVTRVADSCGFGVPRMRLQGQRQRLDQWAARKDDGELADYQRRKNARSIDGLPALRLTADGEG